MRKKKPLREAEERFARFFVADPRHSVGAAAKKTGYRRQWAYKVIRKPEVIAYIRELAGRDPEELRRRNDADISEGDVAEAREAELVAPSENDITRVFDRLRTFMDFRLVDYLTPPDEALALSAEKIRALAGTDLGRAIKKFKHREFSTVNKEGQVTSTTNTYEIECESPLQATQAMAKVLGIDRTDSEDKRRRAEQMLEAVLKTLPESVQQQIYLAMLQHGAALLSPTNGKPS